MRSLRCGAVRCGTVLVAAAVAARVVQARGNVNCVCVCRRVAAEVRCAATIQVSVWRGGGNKRETEAV